MSDLTCAKSAFTLAFAPAGLSFPGQLIIAGKDTNKVASQEAYHASNFSSLHSPRSRSVGSHPGHAAHILSGNSERS